MLGARLPQGITMSTFSSFDGVRIAYRTFGEGRPALLLHGFLANAELNWFTPGIAAAVAATGRKVIAPDLRGHGGSEAPERPDAYPRDVLAMDQEALLKLLDIRDYDLVGYSLGARTAVRMLARGARPRSVILGGMGDTGVVDVAQRRVLFEDAIKNGDKGANPQAGKIVQAMMAQNGLKPIPMLRVLESQCETTKAELKSIATPTLVVSGKDDADNGSAEALASLLGKAKAARVPGNHLTAVGTPELQNAIVEFLSAEQA
jgi:pimeloyl-ACP methyl ester carboxylesterase